MCPGVPILHLASDFLFQAGRGPTQFVYRYLFIPNFFRHFLSQSCRHFVVIDGQKSLRHCYSHLQENCLTSFQPLQFTVYFQEKLQQLLIIFSELEQNTSMKDSVLIPGNVSDDICQLFIFIEELVTFGIQARHIELSSITHSSPQESSLHSAPLDSANC